MERIYGGGGGEDILYDEGDPSDRVRCFWQIDRVGDKKNHEIDGFNYADVEVSYFMRCPYCDKMMSVLVIVGVSENMEPLRTHLFDCLLCDCGRHYYVLLRGMGKAIRGILESREAQTKEAPP